MTPATRGARATSDRLGGGARLAAGSGARFILGAGVGEDRARVEARELDTVSPPRPFRGDTLCAHYVTGLVIGQSACRRRRQRSQLECRQSTFTLLPFPTETKAP